MGKGANTGTPYYDVVITRQPTQGILIKLPYTKKGGKFSFDLHHRIGLTPDFGLPAEVTTVVEVLSGGTTSLGVFTIADNINARDTYDEPIIKASAAEIDKYVSPMSSKTFTLDIRPGPQSISIVGQLLIITRDTTTTRIDTPGTRLLLFRTSSSRKRRSALRSGGSFGHAGGSQIVGFEHLLGG